MRNYQEEFLCHYGVPGMKWGHRKQRVLKGRIGGSKKSSAKQQRKNLRKQRLATEKQNYNIVKNRLKEKGIDSMKLQNQERGGISRKKVKKYLGKDITVSQVSDYVKRQNKKANRAAIGAAAGGTAAAMAYLFLRK